MSSGPAEGAAEVNPGCKARLTQTEILQTAQWLRVLVQHQKLLPALLMPLHAARAGAAAAAAAAACAEFRLNP